MFSRSINMSSIKVFELYVPTGRKVTLETVLEAANHSAVDGDRFFIRFDRSEYSVQTGGLLDVYRILVETDVPQLVQV